MNETSLRAILTFDEKTQRYIPAGHNLSVEKAEERAAELRSKGLRVSIAFQALRHKGHGFKNCEPCRNAAENLSGPQRTETPAEDAEEAPL